MKKEFAILILLFTASFMNAQQTVPDIIQSEVETALSFYPQLDSTEIEFRFKKNIKKSTMQARPTFKSLFKNKKKRSYVVLISEKFKVSDQEFRTTDIPSDIFIGWIGHELGHIMDYRHQSNIDLIWFGINYLFSNSHIVEAERAADSFAVAHGMEAYILKTKHFILDHAEISTVYKERINKYYLSPEEIMELVTQREASLNTD